MFNLLRNPVTLVTVVVTFLVCAVLVFFLLETGHDPSAFVATLAPIAVVVTGLLAIGAQQQQTANKVDQAVKQTNGNFSAAQAQIAELHSRNTVLTAALGIQKATPDLQPAVPTQAQATATQLTNDLAQAVTLAANPPTVVPDILPALVPVRE